MPEIKQEENIYEKRLWLVFIINIILFVLLVLIIVVAYILSLVNILNTKDSVLIGEIAYLNQNRSINPCEDFYEYSCGGFLYSKDENDGPFRKQRKFETIEAEAILKFSRFPNPKEPLGLRYLKQFLHKCMNQDVSETEKIKNLMYDLCFPISLEKKSDWYPNTFSLDKLIIDLIKNKLEYQALFQLYVGYPLGKNKKSVPSLMIGAPKQQYVGKLKPFYDDICYFVCEIAGCSGEGEPEKFQKEDRDNMKDLQKRIFNVVKNESNEIEIFNERITFQNLNKLFPNLITESVIKAILGEDIKFTYDLEFYLTTSEVEIEILKNIDEILNNPNDQIKRDITNYVLYIALLSADQFVHKIFEKEAKIIRCKSNLIIDKRLKFSYDINYFYSYVKSTDVNEINRLTEDIIEELQQSLKRQTWLTNESKEKAQNKLDSLRTVYGIPREFQNNTKSLNYDPFDREIELNMNESFFTNAIRIHAAARQYEFKQLNKKNSKLWILQAAQETVSYLQFKNMLYISNEILHDEIWSMNIPFVAKIAYTGTFIASKLTQGFDLTGCNFDKDGAFENWWSRKTLTEYKLKSECLIKQYNEYQEPNTKLNVSGTRTYLENIADQNGLTILKEVYRSYLKNSNGGITIPAFLDYTPKQLFWILYAQAYCSKYSNENLEIFMQQSKFSPDRFRVIGTVINSNDFADAFSCPQSSKMNPSTKRCIIWD